MNPLPLISPKFHAAVAPIFKSVCSIQMVQAGAADQDAYGAPHGRAQRQYVARPGCSGIQCTIGPEYLGAMRSAKEVRQSQFTMEWNDFVVTLNGYFPSIVQTDQAVVDGKTYEVQGADSDDLKVFTHLHCRTLEV